MSGKRDKRQGAARREQASRPPMPTEAELAILRVLWDVGPATVRQVNETMNRRQNVGMTTTLKFMQIMVDKGLLIRDDSVRPQIFRPACTQEQTQQRLLGDFLERTYAGSTRTLVLQALDGADLDADQLAAVEKLLDKIDPESP
ncbi:MAG: BlaI/MecI/CopY family transcriptional regulator [Planctomycetaceae bacterium]|nr:BlaI/MecI/CopY family transcriptional regulator [Planctomycetaceae bacterium]